MRCKCMIYKAEYQAFAKTLVYQPDFERFKNRSDDTENQTFGLIKKF